MNKGTLVIDIGGTHVKLMMLRQQARQFDSGPRMGPKSFVKKLKATTGGWKFDKITIGFPAPIREGRILRDPKHLGDGWTKFDFRKALRKSVQVINDAAMQALGSYEGGRMLFLGLGTGLGSAMIVNGVLEPMELAHLPYEKGRTYEDYVGIRGLKRLGKKKWRRHVADVVKQLKAALEADYVILGGGNAKLLKTLPAGARLGDNNNAFRGGFRLWKDRLR